MRDLETVAIAIETAETGHLVFGTLHTSTAATHISESTVVVASTSVVHRGRRGRHRRLAVGPDVPGRPPIGSTTGGSAGAMLAA